MRIKAVDFPPAPEAAFERIQMTGLGSLVVIAGPNGAGKSRFLGRIIKWTESFQQNYELYCLVRDAERALETTTSGDPNRKALEEQLKLNRQRLGPFQRQQLTLTDDQIPIIVPFVPRNFDLVDPADIAKSRITTLVQRLTTPGIESLANGAFCLIQTVLDRWRESRHVDSSLSEDEKHIAVANYERLQELLLRFPNTRITRSKDGEPQLFGLELGRAALSNGQKVLLELVAAIYAQRASLSNLILFMDEPENHLHPAALLDVIETVRECIGHGGQLWIATHSVPLLTNVPSESIWWMQNRTIKKAGNEPDLVLSGLLGDEGRRVRLASFLDLPSVLAANRFAAECILAPETTPHRNRDPQTRQMREAIGRLITKDQPKLRILDFGAGKGRLATELAEWLPATERDKIDYFAFDKFRSDRDECLHAIARLHGDAEDRLIHSMTDLTAKCDHHSFDLVVMCNVLHEVPPTQWTDLFGPGGSVTAKVKSSGFLLLVETQQLPYGECAHEFGFLVLDTAELKRLFAVAETTPGFRVADSLRDGWLKAHLIPQSCFTHLTRTTCDAALDQLCRTARERIADLRQDIQKCRLNNKSTYLQGRKLAFWVHQYANAALALPPQQVPAIGPTEAVILT